MRFDLIDWALLVLVSTVASLATRLVMALLGAFDRTSAVPLVAALFIFFLLSVYATWLVLRTCIDDFRFGRWLGAHALGAALAIGLMLLASWALPAGDVLGHPRPGRPVPAAPLLWWLWVLALGVAYYSPPGLLLQRLSGARAWPFIIGGAVSGVIGPLLAAVVPTQVLNLLGTAGIGQGVISGLALGAGLFLMARQGAGTRLGT